MSGSLVELLHLCDSLFPIGSFAHSDGLETATSGGQITTATELARWMQTSLDEGLRRMEGPCVWRAWQSGAPSDERALDELQRLDVELHALRPAASGREASRAMGTRLLRTWRQIRPKVALGLLDAHVCPLTLPVAFGVVSRASDIGGREALTGFMYARLAAIVSAAMRLMPLGQHDGHALLASMLTCVPAAADAVMTANDLPCAFAPAMDIAMMGQQYGESRLFRS